MWKFTQALAIWFISFAFSNKPPRDGDCFGGVLFAEQSLRTFLYSCPQPVEECEETIMNFSKPTALAGAGIFGVTAMASAAPLNVASRDIVAPKAQQIEQVRLRWLPLGRQRRRALASTPITTGFSATRNKALAGKLTE
jgi:hypothetical protein